jgi:hypothetical protein
MKEEWKMSPYLGVLPFVFNALQHTRHPFRDSLAKEQGLFT